MSPTVFSLQADKRAAKEEIGLAVAEAEQLQRRLGECEAQLAEARDDVTKAADSNIDGYVQKQMQISFSGILQLASHNCFVNVCLIVGE